MQKPKGAKKLQRDVNRSADIINRLDREIKILLHHRAIFDKLNDQATKYPRSRAANTYRFLMDSSLWAIALGLGRIWDRDPASLTIPALVKLLNKPLILSWYGDERVYFSDIDESNKAAVKAAHAETAKQRDAITAAAKAIESHDVQTHLREFRNTVLAHASGISKEAKSKGTKARYPYFGELIDLSDSTIKLAGDFHSLMLRQNEVYRDYRTHCDEHVQDLIDLGLDPAKAAERVKARKTGGGS